MSRIQEFKSIDEFLKASDITINSRFPDFAISDWKDMEDYTCLSGISYSSHYFEITIVEDAAHSLTIDQFDFKNTSNNIFFISPYRLQSTLSDQAGPVSGFTILFHPEFIHTSNFSFFHRLNTPALPLNDTSKQEFLDLFRKIMEEYHHTKNTFSREIIKHYLSILLLKGKQHLREIISLPSASSREQEIYNQFMDLVQQHFTTLHTVKGYADLMYISAKHLSETVRNISGQSALEIIHNIRIHHAKSLLRQTNMTVFQIAQQLQFEDVAYFSRFFKRLAGESPIKFRHS